MKVYFRPAFVFVFITIYTFVNAQPVDSMMSIYRDNYPQEKIHVHFDKNYYNPGETIWFKAYVLSGINLSAISKNFYAELMNDKGAVIRRIVAPVVNSSAASSFVIPVEYAGQVIHFRAFTTWMLNFDPEFLYEKNIQVIAANGNSSPVNENSTLLQFFPEGGDLVVNLETVLAFKANDRFGLPVKVSGYISNANGKKIATFNTRHNGLGSFSFTPLPGEAYTAKWKDSTNKEMSTPLPVPKNTGILLNIKNVSNNVTFTVKRTDGVDLLRQVYIIAHMDQQMVYKARINLTDNFQSSGRIPVDQLPSGILQVTLFNSRWEPMAERIVFVNNNDYMFDTYVRTVSKNMAKRSKNIIEIEIPDTLTANLSVAVTDATINVPGENEEDIYSRLLLTGDIRGYVHNPGYYFSSFADSTAQQLDLVMLTHGWRRFNWENLAKGIVPVLKYPVDDYIALSGKLMGASPGILANNNELNLIFQFRDSSSQFVSVPLQQGGKITTGGMVFYDTAKVFYQLNKDRRQAGNLILNLENGLWKGYGDLNIPFDRNMGLVALNKAVIDKNKNLFEQTIQLESDKTKKVKMLQEVIVRGSARSAIQKIDDRYTSGLFKGGDGYSFDVANDLSGVGSISLFTYLQGKVPGLMINNAMSSQPALTWRGGTPDLYLDEMRSDAQMLSSISMADVAYIKVFRPPFIGSFGGGGGGAIAVYTRRGGDTKTNNNFAGLSKVNVMGYTPVKEFYSPNYAQNDPLHVFDDLRSTLYWSPFVFLDKENKRITISFYNNDISKKLRVVVEGVNENGKLTRVENMIQ